MSSNSSNMQERQVFTTLVVFVTDLYISMYPPPPLSPRANKNDGSCRPPSHNTTLGGVYQTCNQTHSDAGDLCADLLQTNPATGAFSCPTGGSPLPACVPDRLTACLPAYPPVFHILISFPFVNRQILHVCNLDLRSFALR